MEARTERYTLCWRCRRATNAPGLGCSWSRRVNPEPVAGWDARPTRIKNSRGACGDALDESYIVFACPEFLDDADDRPLTDAKARFVEVDGQWLTTGQACKRLGVTRSSIYGRIERGTLNAKLTEGAPEFVFGKER